MARPGLALVAASVLLPIVLFTLAAWYGYRETVRAAEAQVERTVRILEEHALKVFESHRLVIDEVNLRLRFMDRSREADLADLHQMLVRLQNELDQVSTITVMDAKGRMIASGRTYPADPAITFADRRAASGGFGASRRLELLPRTTDRPAGLQSCRSDQGGS